MISHAQVVVIGSGIAGDPPSPHALGLDRSRPRPAERTRQRHCLAFSGPLLHALRQSRDDRVTRETIKTFGDVEADTGRSAGFLKIGSLTLVVDPERIDELKPLGPPLAWSRSRSSS